MPCCWLHSDPVNPFNADTQATCRFFPSPTSSTHRAVFNHAAGITRTSSGRHLLQATGAYSGYSTVGVVLRVLKNHGTLGEHQHLCNWHDMASACGVSLRCLLEQAPPTLTSLLAWASMVSLGLVTRAFVALDRRQVALTWCSFSHQTSTCTDTHPSPSPNLLLGTMACSSNIYDSHHPSRTPQTPVQ